MKEYGGYIELDTYALPMLHEGALALNCGRNCLAYLIEARQIKKLLLPYYMCDSVFNVCTNMGVEMQFYHIDEQFRPEEIELADDAWLYVMNFYGQLTREYLAGLKQKYQRVIVDNAQAYFDAPLPDTDTLYTCRKFFGVADGAFLYTDAVLDRALAQDESFERMHFLLGRFERTASEFYSENVANNEMFDHEPVKRMSKLTDNLLHGIRYDFVKERRTENYRHYHSRLKARNQLALREDTEGAFAYPLLIPEGAELRHLLQQRKIYIPTLWPNVLSETEEHTLEYRLANTVLSLPCDQRYDNTDINNIIQTIEEVLR